MQEGRTGRGIESGTVDVDVNAGDVDDGVQQRSGEEVVVFVEIYLW
jgi:hypothetical protein